MVEPEEVFSALNGSPGLDDEVRLIDDLVASLNASNVLTRYAAAWAMNSSMISAWQWSGEQGEHAKQKVVKALASHLSDSDSWVRVRLLESLSSYDGYQGVVDQDAFALLGDTLNDPDPSVRAAGIRVLEPWAMDQAIRESLLRAGEDEVWVVRAAAYWSVGYPVQALLSSALTDENPWQRARALRILARHLPKDSIAELIRDGLRDPSGVVVMEAILLAQENWSARLVEPLLELVRTQARWEKTVGGIVLEMTGKSLDELRRRTPVTPYAGKLTRAVREPETKKHLTALKSQRASERVSAVLGLTWSEDAAAVPAILEAIEDKDPHVRFAAVEALHAYIQSRSRQSLAVLSSLETAATADTNPIVRAHAVRALLFFKHFEATAQHVTQSIETVIEKDSSPLVRLAIVRALNDNKLPSCKSMISLTQDAFAGLRHEAMRRLRMSCGPAGMTEAARALRDPVWSVRQAAIEYVLVYAKHLWEMQNSSIRSSVMERLERIAKGDLVPKVRGMAAKALDVIKETRPDNSSRQKEGHS